MTTGLVLEPLLLRVSTETDRFWCAREVRRVAGTLGFAERAQWELAIVAAELVSNAVRYGGSGTLTLRAAAGPRHGIEIAVEDPGAPARPGKAPRRGLGHGLQTVRYLCHRVERTGAPAGGTLVTATRYLEP